MRHIITCLVVAFALVTLGCDNKKDSTDSTDKGSTASLDHDHHDHHHGPNGGQPFEFDNEDYKGEVVGSKDNQVVQFYLLTKDQGNASLKVDKFVVTPLAGNDATPHELASEKADDEGKSHIYSLDNQDLRIAVPLGVSVEVVAGDLQLKGTIDPYEPCYH